MKPVKFIQFFQDEDGANSMHRLGFFGAFVISSIIMLYFAFLNRLSDAMLQYYITAFALTAVFSKAIDSRTFGNKSEVAKPPEVGTDKKEGA